jgi:hypothetical protein
MAMARWLQKNENVWGIPVLDCTQHALGRKSSTGNPEIARKYVELRKSSGRELLEADFKPTQSVPCNLTYKVASRPPDGPLF